MRISERSHPILSKLKTGSLKELLPMPEDMFFFKKKENHLAIAALFEKYHQWFASEVNVLSDPFFSAYLSAREKLIDFYHALEMKKGSTFSANGTFIVGNVIGMLHQEWKDGSQHMNTAYFQFDKEGSPLIFFADIDAIKTMCWVSLSILPSSTKMEDMLKFIDNTVAEVCALALFKKYAQIETTLLPAGQKVKGIDCKYFNATKLDINYINSSWFTNLVKSDGFSVRGHFRLQPKKKNGEWTKELIWIEDYQKSGYVSLARKLKKENNDI